MMNDEQDDYYVSVFAGRMAEFIRFKRGQGLAYQNQPGRLRAFSCFIAGKMAADSMLTSEIVDEWCRQHPNETRSNQYQRVNAARQFLTWLTLQGAQVPLPRAGNLRIPVFVPYVFSHAEIDRFFVAADRGAGTVSSALPLVAPVLFRLLYGCGLRISEALNLTVDDVDLTQGCLTIRHAKNDKDRLVPMSSALTDAMRAYAELRPHGGRRECGRFFTNRDGRPVEHRTVDNWFRQILWSARISHSGSRKGPRIHDFRHTFAVHTLKAMTDTGADIYCALPILSTYLGHASVSATNQYVRLTQELFPEVVAKTSAISAYVIPGGEPS